MMQIMMVAHVMVCALVAQMKNPLVSLSPAGFFMIDFNFFGAD